VDVSTLTGFSQPRLRKSTPHNEGNNARFKGWTSCLHWVLAVHGVGKPWFPWPHRLGDLSARDSLHQLGETMETEKKIVLQEFERQGRMGIFWYGEEDSDQKTWEKRVVIYRKPVIRSKAEAQAEQKRMLLLGVYDDDSTINVVLN